MLYCSSTWSVLSLVSPLWVLITDCLMFIVLWRPWYSHQLFWEANCFIFWLIWGASCLKFRCRYNCLILMTWPWFVHICACRSDLQGVIFCGANAVAHGCLGARWWVIVLHMLMVGAYVTTLWFCPCFPQHWDLTLTASLMTMSSTSLGIPSFCPIQCGPMHLSQTAGRFHALCQCLVLKLSSWHSSHIMRSCSSLCACCRCLTALPSH